MYIYEHTRTDIFEEMRVFHRHVYTHKELGSAKILIGDNSL